jgi:hypothetical protein
MGYKMLKDAGVVPAEVELMRDIEALRNRWLGGSARRRGGAQCRQPV